MEFVETLGALGILVGCFFILAYGIRHRGAISSWLNNLNHEENIDEKDCEITRLRRKKEDIEKRLATLKGD